MGRSNDEKMNFQKKRISLYFLAGVMLLGVVILLIIQIDYLNRIETIRRDNFFRQCKTALAEVDEELQLSELVRFLNANIELKCSEQKDDAKVLEFESVLAQGKLKTQQMKPILESDSIREQVFYVPFKRSNDSITLTLIGGLDSSHRYFSDVTTSLLTEYYHNRNRLDSYILKYVYERKKDSLPQLINPRDLVSSVRQELLRMGINTPFSLQLFDKHRTLVYEALTPGMRRVIPSEKNSVVQNLFMGYDGEEQSVPFIRVVFDEPLYGGRMRDSFLGLAVTIIMFIITMYAVWALVRQIRFQKQKTDFINNMAHEIKTPVSSIALAGQMLRDESIRLNTEKINRIINVINSETHRIKLLSEKVLQMAKFDDRFKLKLKPVDAHEVILSVVRTMALRIESHGGTLDLDLEAEHTWVMADEVHFVNMIYNLMENSIKYARMGVILKIKISSSNRQGRNPVFVMSIRDNGIGMTNESIKHIFDRYYRVPTGNQHDVKGFGLGLAYVKHVVTQMNGNIKVRSVLGEGTIMKIELPVAKII